MCSSLTGGENSLWGGSFSPPSSQHLPRCRWGGAVAVLADGLDGKIKTGDPLSSFPIRSSVPPGTLRGVCPRLWSPSPAAAEAPRWVRSRGSHIDLADGLETGSPYFHLYSPGLALSRDTHSFCDDLAGGENSLWGGSFHLRSSQHLPRCRWGGAVAVLADGLDGKMKTGDPLSSFPIRSSVRCNALCSRRARSEECVRAYDLAVPLLLRHRGEWDHGAHIDLADGLETGSPYFHLYSPGLALSRGGSLSCSSSPLSESALICSSFSPRRFICFVPSCLGNARIMVILGSFMHFQTVFTCLGVWLHLILIN